MKQVALVAAHFPPSNLAGVHRARLWTQHLEEFGWRPIVVTTHWRHYEERLDWELCELLDPGLEVIRTPALPTKPVRLVGDIGIRGFAWHLAALQRLLRERRVDFVHITVPSFYSALLGRCLFRKRPVPFGIDYIDPWVHVWPEAEKRFSKAWASMKLGAALEPGAVRHASLITGIGKGYFSGVLERNPQLHQKAVVAAMPYGNSARDFELVRGRPRKPALFDPEDGRFHLVYAGAMLPKAYPILDRLLAALAQMRDAYPRHYARLRLHFVGTGKSPEDPAGFNILPRAERLGLGGLVTEHPQRISYVDVLLHLACASAILILGSTEPHYSPSKVYQSIAARRPILALLHDASPARRVLEETNAGVVVPLTETRLPQPADLARRLACFIDDARREGERVNWARFEAYSARESCRRLAAALDRAAERFGAVHPRTG